MTGNIKLPAYTKTEEKYSTITHATGVLFAITALCICVIFAARHHNTAGILSGIIYGVSMTAVYLISSIYHAIDPEKHRHTKEIMRIVDHCDIYGLIIGTFAPVAFTGLYRLSPVTALISFGIVCLTAVVGTVFTAVDFARFKIVSYAGYFVAGWSVLMTAGKIIDAFSSGFMIMLIVGGAVYTAGMIFYVLQKKGHPYCHCVFHIFILFGSVIQFIPIAKYCM